MSVVFWRDGASALFVHGERRVHVDLWLCLSALALILFGYVMVVSASLHLGKSVTYYPLHQLAHITAGLAIAGVIALVPLERVERWSLPLYCAGIGLLVLVLIPGVGVEVNGSSRWLAVPGVRVQVSELIKLFSVVYMARFIHIRQAFVQSSLWGMAPPLSLLAIACALMVLEPDLGSAVVVMATALGMLFLAGARLLPFVVTGGLLAMAAGALVLFVPWRLKRLLSFLDPWQDARDTGFQLTQALIAFGRGEWFGVGLGSGLQKLNYLPEAHTDFLFSVIGEELGLVGALAVLALFVVLVWRTLAIGWRAEAAGLGFGAYCAYGVGLWFGIQALVNMGVNMGALPTKGLTLPLMSYGGSSMVVMCAALALLLRVDNEAHIRLSSVAREKVSWRRTS